MDLSRILCIHPGHMKSSHSQLRSVCVQFLSHFFTESFSVLISRLFYFSTTIHTHTHFFFSTIHTQFSFRSHIEFFYFPRTHDNASLCVQCNQRGRQCCVAFRSYGFLLNAPQHRLEIALHSTRLPHLFTIQLTSTSHIAAAKRLHNTTEFHTLTS